MIEELQPFNSPINLPSGFPTDGGTLWSGTPHEKDERSPSGLDAKDPSEVTIYEGSDPGTYECTVAACTVFDHLQNDADAVIPWPVPNQFDGTFADGLARFAILEGGKAYIAVWRNELGAVDPAAAPAGHDACEVVIWEPGTAALVSIAYTPPVGDDDAGNTAGGVDYYLLARFDITDGAIAVTPFGMKDNIQIYRESQPWQAPGTDGVNFLTKHNHTTGYHEVKLARAKPLGSGVAGIQLKVEKVLESGHDTPPVVEFSATQVDEYAVPIIGGTGDFEVLDCAGYRLWFFEWKNGSVTTNGQTKIYLPTCEEWDSSWSTPSSSPPP